jgi:hypothetical protein
MAIGIQFDFPGGTLEQYDRVARKLGYRSGGAGPAGSLFHWIAKTGDGIRVTEVWESRAQSEQFFKEQIGPATAEVGVPGPPQVTFFEVHNYLTKG